jgi:hypothetical protein
MRTFIFVFNDGELDDTGGVATLPSFSVQADDYGQALVRLAAALGGRPNYSSDPMDYRDDIDNGSVSVYCPTVLPV